MGNFVVDTFSTGANWSLVTTRSGETGASWSGYSGVDAEWYMYTPTGVALPGGSSGVVKASGVSASNDHSVTVTVSVKTTADGSSGIFVRGHETQADFYACYLGGGSDAGKIVLAQYDNNVAVDALGTWSGVTTGTHTLKLEVDGTAIKVYWDGTERISTTDSSITTGVRVGMRAFNISTPTTGKHFTDFTATDDSTGSFATTVFPRLL